MGPPRKDPFAKPEPRGDKPGFDKPKEMIKKDNPKSEPPKDAIKKDPPRKEPVKDDVKNDPPKKDPPKEDAKKDPPKKNPPKDEPKRDGDKKPDNKPSDKKVEKVEINDAAKPTADVAAAAIAEPAKSTVPKPPGAAQEVETSASKPPTN